MKPISILFVGVDVSRDNQICAINFNQDMFYKESFKNTPEASTI